MKVHDDNAQALVELLSRVNSSPIGYPHQGQAPTSTKRFLPLLPITKIDRMVGPAGINEEPPELREGMAIVTNTELPVDEWPEELYDRYMACYDACQKWVQMYGILR